MRDVAGVARATGRRTEGAEVRVRAGIAGPARAVGLHAGHVAASAHLAEIVVAAEIARTAGPLAGVVAFHRHAIRRGVGAGAESAAAVRLDALAALATRQTAGIGVGEAGFSVGAVLMA